VGQASQAKGDLLEGQQQEAIRQITKLGYDVQQAWTNLYWNDQKSLGEVDLLLQTNQGWVIVEFKARAFDIMAAYYQNGPERDIAKRWLTLARTRVVLDNTVPTFIVTILPDNPFVLPMESELKKVVSYRVKHPDASLSELTSYARTVISPDRQRPIDWYLKGGYRHVIVMPASASSVSASSSAF
jgi:Holliday junction resolvase-like predicted endonuclease